MFKSINKAYTSAFVDLATPRLTRMLEVVTSQHQPPMVNGRRIKLRYAHQGGQNPPIIVIHGEEALKVPQSYQRYLVNHFTKALRLFGTPLRVEFRQDDNPFQETKRVKPGRTKPVDRQRKKRTAKSASRDKATASEKSQPGAVPHSRGGKKRRGA